MIKMKKFLALGVIILILLIGIVLASENEKIEDYAKKYSIEGLEYSDNFYVKGPFLRGYGSEGISLSFLKDGEKIEFKNIKAGSGFRFENGNLIEVEL